MENLAILILLTMKNNGKPKEKSIYFKVSILVCMLIGVIYCGQIYLDIYIHTHLAILILLTMKNNGKPKEKLENLAMILGFSGL